MSKGLRRRVESAAERTLAERKCVTPVDVCVGIGWLTPVHVDRWRQGRVAALADFLPVPEARLGDLLEYLERWATEKGLRRSEVSYIAATRDRRELRFVTPAGSDAAERSWRAQWTSPDLTDKQSDRIAQRRSAAPDLVVIQPATDFTCAGCGDTGGDLLIMDDAGPLCLTCADLDHLVFLPVGNAALTRRSKKASRLSAVVVRWSKARKRYERQGLLVEEPALAQAERECLADSEVRARRRDRDTGRRARADALYQEKLAAEIRRLYPRCPADRAEEVAAHAAVRGSGRVGRSAAARVLDPEAIRLAVVASIRHLDTDYDDLLMSGVPRDAARDQIRPAIDRVLASWS